MGLGLLAFAPSADEPALRREYGETLGWGDVVALVGREAARLDTLFAASAGPAPAARQSAAAITVSPDGEVRSIGEALRRARPGARIVVRGGVYREPTIVVDKPVEIVGEGWPVLDGAGSRQIMSVGADDVTVRGLVFRNVGTSFIEDRAAIKVTGARGCTIEGNRIEDAFFGIYLAAVTDCRVARNAIHASAATEATSGNGIHVWGSSGVTIEDNRVEGHRDGIYFEFVRNSVARRNVSEGNLRYGLHFMYSDDCHYVENAFRRNLAGVAVMYTKRVELVGNGWAVKLMASTYDGRFEHNDFEGNTFDVSSNSRESSNRFAGNYFDAYRGYDLGRDGVGDVPHRPVRLFSVLVEQNPPALILLRGFFVDLLDVAERVAPLLTPETLVDERPAMTAWHAGPGRVGVR